MSWCVQAAQLGAVASGFGGVRPLRQPAMPAARISSSSCLDAECLAIRKESGPWGAPTPRHWAHTERSGATAIRGVGVQASARGLAVTATYPPGHGHRDTRGMPERRFIHSSPASGSALRAKDRYEGVSRAESDAPGVPKASRGASRSERQGGEGEGEEEARPTASHDQELFELRFGELLGEDPVKTRAKIMARRKNPDLTLVDVEKQVGGKGRKELQAMFTALTQQQRQKQQQQLLQQSQQRRLAAQGASPGTPPAPPAAGTQGSPNLSAPPSRPKEAIFQDPSSALRLQARPGAGARRPTSSAGAAPVAVRKPQVLQSGRLAYAELPPEVEDDETSVIQPMKVQRRAESTSGAPSDTDGPQVSEGPRPTASLAASASSSPSLTRPAPPVPPSAPPVPVGPRPNLAPQGLSPLPPPPTPAPTLEPEAASTRVAEARELLQERERTRSTGEARGAASSAAAPEAQGAVELREAEGTPPREPVAPRLQQAPRAPVVPLAAPPRPAPPRAPTLGAPAAGQQAKPVAGETEKGQQQLRSQAIPVPGRPEDWSDGVQEAMRRAVARERQEAALLDRLRGSDTVTSQGSLSETGLAEGEEGAEDASVPGAEAPDMAGEGGGGTQTPVTNFVERGTAAQLAQAGEASSAPSRPAAPPLQPPLRPSRPPAPAVPPLQPPGAPAADQPAAYPPIPQLSVAPPASLAPRLSLRNSRPDSRGAPLLPPKPKEATAVPQLAGTERAGKGAPGPAKPRPFVPQPSSDPMLAGAIAELQEMAKNGTAFEVEAVQVASGGIRVMYKNVPAFVPSVLLSLKRGLPAYEAWCACNSDAILAEARRQGRLPPAGPATPQPESESDSQSQAVVGFPEAQGSLPPPSPSPPVVSLVEAGAARAILVEAYQALRLKVFQETLGKRLRVMVAHMNARGTFILSEKDAEKKDPEDLKYRQELMRKLRVGEEVKCTVLNLMRYGALVELRGTTAFISYSDSPWPVSSPDKKGEQGPMEMLEIGKEYDASIARLDFSNNRIFLTMRQGDVVMEALDQLLQRPFAGAREVEAVVRMLREHPGVTSASVAPHRTSSIQAPAFQIYLSAPVENGFKLLACSENEQQEIFVETSMNKDAMRDLIQAAILQLGSGGQ